jgi:hypothetical protein
MLCSTAPSLPWVAWASLPHLRRYYAPLRLPSVPFGGFACRSPSRYLACFRVFVVSPEGSWPGRKLPTTPGPVVTRSPTPGMWSRRQVALPRSRVPPVAACPALRPRWCPRLSPSRVQDCCLPALAHRRLSPRYLLRDILLSTTLHMSGLHHAACVLATPGFVRPLTGRHAGSLLTGWLDVSQGGLEPYGSHLLGNNNQFPGFSPIPKVSGLPWREQARVRR